jgi:lysophospholipase L1-like esterase
MESSGPPQRIGTGKAAVFTTLAVVLCLLLLETAAFLYFLKKGEIKGDLAFHPLFLKARGYQNATYRHGQYMFDPFLAYRYRPHSNYGKLNINEHAFIDNGRPFPALTRKPEGTTRIFCFGGSTLAGSGASSNQATIPARMEELLNAKGSGRFEVINAGIDGYFSYNQLGFLVSDVLAYEPDIVVFYDGWNDYAYPTWVGGYRDPYQKDHCRVNHHEYALYLLTIFPKLESRGCPAVNINHLVKKTYTTALLDRAFRKMLGIPRFESTVDVRELPTKVVIDSQEASRRYLRTVRSAIGVATANRVRLLYALQPTILDKPVLTEEERAFFKERPALASKVSYPEKIHEFYRITREQFGILGRSFNSDSVFVTDVSQDMWSGVEETVYLDECHTNDQGNRVVAAKLVKTLEESVLSPQAGERQTGATRP